MTKRANGLGSVRTLGPNRFQAVSPRLPNRKRPSLGVYPTWEQADEMRAAAVQRLASADLSRLPGVTLRQYGDRHLDDLEVGGDRSMAQRRSAWAHVLSAPFVDDPIDAIRRAVVAAWVKILLKSMVVRWGKRQRISRATARQVIGYASAVFVAAMDEGLCEANPFAGHRIKSEERDEDLDEVWTYLEPDEQRALLTCPEVALADRLAIAFALGTGLRQGEQFNLELRDLVVDGPQPHAFVRWGSKGRKPKNGKRRKVPLFGIALEAAHAWLRLLPSFAPSNPEGLVFPTARGFRRRKSKHLHSGKGGRINRFRLALDAAGIKRAVRWHDLRHSCAAALVSGMWGRTWRLEEVREVLGHSSIRITERYAHLAPSVVTELAARTGGLPVAYEPVGLEGDPSGGSRADRALAAPSSPTSCWGESPPTIPHTSTTRNRGVRQSALDLVRAVAARDGGRAEQATAGLIAAARAEHAALDVDAVAAVLLEEEPREAALLRLADAALEGAEEQAKRGRR